MLKICNSPAALFTLNERTRDNRLRFCVASKNMKFISPFTENIGASDAANQYRTWGMFYPACFEHTPEAEYYYTRHTYVNYDDGTYYGIHPCVARYSEGAWTTQPYDYFHCYNYSPAHPSFNDTHFNPIYAQRSSWGMYFNDEGNCKYETIHYGAIYKTTEPLSTENNKFRFCIKGACHIDKVSENSLSANSSRIASEDVTNIVAQHELTAFSNENAHYYYFTGSAMPWTGAYGSSTVYSHPILCCNNITALDDITIENIYLYVKRPKT